MNATNKVSSPNLSPPIDNDDRETFQRKTYTTHILRTEITYELQYYVYIVHINTHHALIVYNLNHTNRYLHCYNLL